jgi:hypothetical protein
LARPVLGSTRRHDVRSRVDGPGIDSQRIAAKVATIARVSNVARIPAVSHAIRVASRLVPADLFSARLVSTRAIADEVGPARRVVTATVSEVFSPLEVSAAEAVPISVSVAAAKLPVAPLVSEGGAAAIRTGRAEARRLRGVGVCGIGAAVALRLSDVALGAVRVDLARRVLAPVAGRATARRASAVALPAVVVLVLAIVVP